MTYAYVVDHEQVLLSCVILFNEAYGMLEDAAAFDTESLRLPQNIEALRELIRGARDRYIMGGQTLLTLAAPEARPN